MVLSGLPLRVFSIFSRCAPTLILCHWHSLRAAGKSAASPKSCPYITRLDNRSRVTRSWGTFSHLLLLWFFHILILFLHTSILVFFFVFICLPRFVSFAHPARLELSLLFHRLTAGVGVFLPPWPPCSAAGHHRYRSRCVESDCCTSPSLCQVCQQQPLSPSGSHCCVIPGRGQCANKKKKKLNKKSPPSQMH